MFICLKNIRRQFNCLLIFVFLKRSTANDQKVKKKKIKSRIRVVANTNHRVATVFHSTPKHTAFTNDPPIRKKTPSIAIYESSKIISHLFNNLRACVPPSGHNCTVETDTMQCGALGVVLVLLSFQTLRV